MYKKILVGLDGSEKSNFSLDAAVVLSQKIAKNELIGCHIYTSKLHKKRFEEMERGLPERYQEETKLEYLRGTHESLISDGMQLISDAYIDPLIQKSNEKGLKCSFSTPEGHNYVELLKVIEKEKADLVILGAYGHGQTLETRLGSLTERVLLYSKINDLLIIKKPLNFKNHPIIVGIDGSKNSYQALVRAIELAQLFDEIKIEIIAIYDPYFHISVFDTIANVLPTEAQKRFNFTAQEKLHDEIIDSGLEQLYKEGLEKGELLAEKMGIKVKSTILTGKVYPKIFQYAALKEASMIIVGRWGLHHEQISLIGSNTHNLSNICSTNILIVNPPTQKIDIPTLKKEESDVKIEWSREALEYMELVPPFARKMAQHAVEKYAIENKLSIIDVETVKEVSKKLGMMTK